MLYFTPGPSQIYPSVKKHVDTAFKKDILSISHRSKTFQEIYKNAVKNISALMNVPVSHHVFFISSSLESMERILQNCVEKKSLHLVNGSFSKTDFEFAYQLGKEPDIVEVEEGQGIELNKLKVPSDTELVMVTQNETSTGVMIPMKDIHDFKKNHPRVLVAIDIVSSAPYPRTDFRYVDMAFFSVQKGFGLPAGLGVLIVRQEVIDRSVALEKKGVLVGTYHSFSSLLKKHNEFQTPETPNVFGLYLLAEITQEMKRKGIKKIRQEIDLKSKLLYDFANTHVQWKPFVKEKKFQSQTTIVIDVKGQSKKVVEYLKKKGFMVGSGYGKFKNDHIRIANFPQHSVKDVKRLIKEMEKIKV